MSALKMFKIVLCCNDAAESLYNNSVSDCKSGTFKKQLYKRSGGEKQPLKLF